MYDRLSGVSHMVNACCARLSREVPQILRLVAAGLRRASFRRGCGYVRVILSHSAVVNRELGMTCARTFQDYNQKRRVVEAGATTMAVSVGRLGCKSGPSGRRSCSAPPWPMHADEGP